MEAALDELWSRDPDAAKKCCLLNDNILSVLPLFAMEAIFCVGNTNFQPELNEQLARALDRYAPEGALVVSSVELPLLRGELLAGAKVATRVQRMRGQPVAGNACTGKKGADVQDVLRESFDRFKERTSEGDGVPAAMVAAALSEALLQLADPEEVTRCLWHVVGARGQQPESGDEDALSQLLEDVEAAGLSLEALEPEPDEHPELAGRLASPWRREWHQGVMDGVEPQEAGSMPLSWSVFQELGERARRLLLPMEAEECSDEQKRRIAGTTLDVTDILTAEECEQFIVAACRRAEKVGWGEERHKDYVTEDVKVWNLEEEGVRQVFAEHVEGKLCGALVEGFQLPRGQVSVSDAFVVRYSVGAQTSLDFHRDGSIFSGIVSLSASEDYEGGGTLFECGTRHRPERGSGILFFGQRGHCGAEITRGTRFILTLFFEFEGFSTEDLVDMLELVDF